jgi:hypothetical protein
MAAIIKLVGTTQAAVAYTVAWSKVSGPGTATFSAPTSLTTGVSLSAAGTYVLRLTVTTADFVTEDDVTVVAAANVAPVVAAGSDFSVIQSTNANIAGSYTTDGFPALEFCYNFSTTVAGTPATGTMRLNHATVTSATQMNIAVTDRFGFNRQADLLSIPSGSVIRLVNALNTALFIEFTCGAFSIVSGYATCSMSSVTATNAAPMANGAFIDFTPTKAVVTTWSMTSGTGTATFGNANALETTVSFSTTGAKVLTLSVNDGVLTGTDTVAVDVNSTLGTDFVRATSQAVPGSANLTADGTVFLIDMSRFPAGWWTAVGLSSATIRVALAGTTTQIPFDVIEFNGTTDTGLLAVKTQAIAGGTGVDVYCGNASNTAYGFNDTYGKHNVYRTAIRGFWPSGGGGDRTRNGLHLNTVGSPTIGAGPIGAQSYTYSSTARSTLLLSAAVNSPISFFSASDTTSPSGSSWFHTIGINRTVGGTLDSANNSVYLLGVGTSLTAIISSINGSGAWQGSSAAATAETWKGIAGIHASDTSRTAVTSAATGATSTVNNIVTGMDHLVIGHFPRLLSAPGVVTNPKVSLCFFFTEAVNANELKYLDLMLKQTVFWPTWTLNPP